MVVHTGEDRTATAAAGHLESDDPVLVARRRMALGRPRRVQFDLGCRAAAVHPAPGDAGSGVRPRPSERHRGQHARGAVPPGQREDHPAQPDSHRRRLLRSLRRGRSSGLRRRQLLRSRSGERGRHRRPQAQWAAARSRHRGLLRDLG